jgi:CRISPR-associated exonuclease Cas4
MESYIQISKINDFLYSPQSLYLHSVYESFDTDIYHEEPQIIGKINHENIEEGRYSTAKRYLQGLSVYSEKYNLGGKIDIYDTTTKNLCERKTYIHNIYEGQRFQLFAQMFAMEEMGYEVKSLSIQSLRNNRRHEIDLPDKHDIARFEKTLQKMREYDASLPDDSVYRCNLSIYRHLSY